MQILKYLRVLSSIDYINNGGCGVAALALARLAKASGFRKPLEIVCMYDEDEYDLCIKERTLVSEGKIDQLELPAHVAVRVDGVIFDSDGIIAPTSFPWFFFVSEEQLVSMLNQPTWNSRFNREKAIPNIEYALGVDLSDIQILIRPEI